MLDYLVKSFVQVASAPLSISTTRKAGSKIFKATWNDHLFTFSNIEKRRKKLLQNSLVLLGLKTNRLTCFAQCQKHVKNPEICSKCCNLCLTSSGHQALYSYKCNCPATIYLFKVNNRNTRKRCEIWAKLTVETLEGRH